MDHGILLEKLEFVAFCYLKSRLQNIKSEKVQTDNVIDKMRGKFGIKLGIAKHK